MGSVFISYRRDDSLKVTQSFAALLQDVLGTRNVFLDIHSISAGEVFPLRLQRALERADVILVVIGPHWSTSTDAMGQLRLANPQDFVRYEVKFALTSGKPVIPVFLDGVALTADDLPSDFASLLAYPALHIDSHDDMKGSQMLALARQIQNAALRSELAKLPRIPYPVLLATVGLTALAGVLVLGAPLFEPLRRLAPNLYGQIALLIVFSAGFGLVRSIQDRLWGWLIILGIAIVGPLVVLAIKYPASNDPLYVTILIITLGAMSLLGKRIARSLTIRRNTRVLKGRKDI